MKKYELMTIFDGRKNEEELASLTKFVEGVIASTGATEIINEVWGLRELAYNIRKIDKGYYIIFRFQADGRSNKDIEKKLNMNEGIFRYLIILDQTEKIMKKMAERAKRKEENLKKRAAAEASREKAEENKNKIRERKGSENKTTKRSNSDTSQKKENKKEA